MERFWIQPNSRNNMVTYLPYTMSWNTPWHNGESMTWNIFSERMFIPTLVEELLAEVMEDGGKALYV